LLPSCSAPLWGPGLEHRHPLPHHGLPAFRCGGQRGFLGPDDLPACRHRALDPVRAPRGRDGEKNIFVAGFALFTASSFFCGASPGFLWLILFRALQGIGGAMITATGPALLLVSLPEQVRGRALGYFSAANARGLAAGFGLGGVILHLLSWEWIFYLNVPVGICAVAIAYLVIPGMPVGV